MRQSDTLKRGMCCLQKPKKPTKDQASVAMRGDTRYSNLHFTWKELLQHGSGLLAHQKSHQGACIPGFLWSLPPILRPPVHFTKASEVLATTFLPGPIYMSSVKWTSVMGL